MPFDREARIRNIAAEYRERLRRPIIDLPDEEQLICLLRGVDPKRIRDFIVKNVPLNLHHPTINLNTPLLTAVDRGEPQILSYLLEKVPTNLNDTTTQPCGRTALMYASFNSRNSEILQILLKKGADPEQTDIRGWSCLQYAIVGERLNNLSFLLDRGFSINTRDSNERTLLMTAAMLSNLEIVRLLMDRGADIHARDKYGFSVLQLAILGRKRDAAIALIERGCDVMQDTPLSKVSVCELAETIVPKVLRCLPKRKKSIEKYDSIDAMTFVDYQDWDE